MNNLIKIMLLAVLFAPFAAPAYDEKSKKLEVKRLTDNVYQHISYKTVQPWGLIGASGLVVIKGKEAHLIDTPWTTAATKQLIKWIEGKGFTLKSAVVTHFHEDASGDLPLLNDLNINTYATSLTNQLLKLNNKEVSNIEISNHELDIFDGIATVYYPGAGHTEDNIIVWLPNEKLLFGGCLLEALATKL